MDSIDIFYPIIYFKWGEYASDYAKSELVTVYSVKFLLKHEKEMECGIFIHRSTWKVATAVAIIFFFEAGQQQDNVYYT